MTQKNAYKKGGIRRKAKELEENKVTKACAWGN